METPTNAKKPSTVGPQFAHYLVVGGVGTALQYSCLIALVHFAESSVVLASTLGALLGASVNYALNYFLTFGSSRPHSVTMPRFLVVAAGGVLLNGLIVSALIATTSVHYLLIQAVATGAVLIAGFLANRLWTF